MPEIDPAWEPTGAFRELIREIQVAVAAAGYTTPTPIQEQCIPHVLAGRDLIGCAQTGTGKTAAFSLPLLQRLAAQPDDQGKRTPRALVLAPTRELSAQIGESFAKYGRCLPLRHTTIFGGVNQFHQVRSMQRGAQIVIATPGRLLDLMQQGHVTVEDIEVLVLDEVDRMLDMGFLPDVKRIISRLPAERQTLLFSATMAAPIVELASSIVRDPIRVSIAPDQPAVERIEQRVLFVPRKDKDALLLTLLKEHGVDKAIIFTQMKHVANRVAEKLDAAGISGDAIHGNKSQAARTRALDRFRKGHARVLVATDVAARGLDVDDITHVINYDLPLEPETYVHRIGRTGRAGADGQAISLCTAEDASCLKQIERLLGRGVPHVVDHAFHCEDTYRAATVPRGRDGYGTRRGGGGGRSGGRSGGGRFGRRR